MKIPQDPCDVYVSAVYPDPLPKVLRTTDVQFLVTCRFDSVAVTARFETESEAKDFREGPLRDQIAFFSEGA